MPYNELSLLTDSTGFPGGPDSKESACNARDPGAIPRLGRTLEKEIDTPVFLPGGFHGERKLVGYNP